MATAPLPLQQRPRQPPRHSDPSDCNLYLHRSGIWQLLFTLRPTRATAERTHLSLGCRSVETARARRDALFSWLLARGLLALRVPTRRFLPAAQSGEQAWLDQVCRTRFAHLAAPSESRRPGPLP
jgi:hypothetical protein